MSAAARSKLLLPLGTLAGGSTTYWAITKGRRDDETHDTRNKATTTMRHYQNTHFTTTATIPAFLAGTTVALCDAPATGLPDFTTVQLPVNIDTQAENLIGRFRKYASGELSEVAKFKKEKNGIKVYTIKEVRGDRYMRCL